MVIFLNRVKLSVAAVAGHHDHIGTGGSDLIKFSPGVEDSFLVIPGCQRPATNATADLIHAIRIGVDPVFHTLAEDPTRFIKVTIPELSLRLPSVITGIVVRSRFGNFRPVQLDFILFDIINEQIKNSDKRKFLKCGWIIFFETRPGCQVGVASFGPQQRVHFQSLHLFDNPSGHYFHGMVVTGKVTPTGPFPVFRGDGPLFTGRKKNFPPMLL